MTGRRPLFVAAGALLLLPVAGHAADPKAAAPDAELLEFLGSGDDGDPELQQYLVKRNATQTDEAKPTRKRGSDQT